MTETTRAHWENVYGRRALTEVSWYERYPRRSVELVHAAGLERHDPLIDVGGGASYLVDALLDEGYGDLTVLDISSQVLSRLRARLEGRGALMESEVLAAQGETGDAITGEPAAASATTLGADARAGAAAPIVLHAAGSRITLVAEDVTKFEPTRHYALWHDRAVFHFLTRPDDRERYVRVLGRALRPGGQLVIATFGPQGPERCSGLPIVRYDAANLTATLGPQFRLQEWALGEHQTPSGGPQQFLYCRFVHTPPGGTRIAG